MKQALSPKWIDGKDCTNGAKPCVDFFDTITPGLCLRVTNGKKSWGLVFTPPGGTSRTRMALGSYLGNGLGMTLLAARAAAGEAKALLDAGTDPRAVVAAERPKTVAELIEERLALRVRGHHRRADEVEWRYTKYVIPLVGDVAVKDFKIDPHYNRVIDPLEKRGVLRLATMVRADLTALFDFAVERGVMEFSRLTKVKKLFKYVPCDRWLTAEEIATLWHSLPAALPRTPDTQAVVQLLLATGQRSNEVAGMTRSEIDTEKAIWTLPAARSKNGHAHAIPLNALAMFLIRERLRHTNGEYLFPRENGKGCKSSNDVATAIDYARNRKVENPLGLFEIAYWTPHDLRRTVATHMSKLGISDGDIGQVLNHRTTTKSTVTQQVYNQNTYLKEKREALDKWGAFLANLVGVETGLRVAA